MKRSLFCGLLGLTLLTSACEKDYLDRVPLDALVDETFWENEDQLRLAANGCYAYLKAKSTVDLENLGDNTLWPSVTDFQRIASGNFGNDVGGINSEWTSAYDGIRRCNAFLANYQRAQVADPARKEALAAEVRVIRAYLYSYLTAFFGDVQLITTPLEISDPAVYGTRAPRAEVVEFMLQELDEAAANLPAAIPTGTNLGRISKGAALALKARIALQEGRYAVAETAAKAVMDLNVYQLYTTGGTTNAYRNLFTYAGKLAGGGNKETILARTHLADISMHNLSREIQVPDQNARWNPTKSLVDSYLCADGLPIEKSPLYKDNNYAAVFANRDPRLVQTILAPGAAWGGRFDGNPTNTNPAVYTTPKFRSDRRGSVTITGYYFTKYVEPTTVAQVSRDANDIHLIRLAEVLLTYAEARFEQGKLTQADVDLTVNRLRQRVGMRNMVLTELAARGLDVRTEIRRERRVELALEGQRYFDILRWQQGRLLAEDVKGIKGTWAYAPADVAGLPTDANGFVIAYRNRSFTASRNYLWPIPLVQLERNPQLGQNPGW